MILATGAEATLILRDGIVEKVRSAKSYRHTELDRRLRRFRTKREAKVLKTLADAGVSVPQVFDVDEKTCSIKIEFIDAPKLKEKLADQPEELGRELGQLIAAMHTAGVVHGDLSTSNVLVAEKLTLIDFGLSFFSEKVEDRAVDLHVLEQILQANHSAVVDVVWNEVVVAYKKLPEAEHVLARLEVVRKRGRNKGK